AVEKKVVTSKVGEKVGLPCCHEIPSSETFHNYRVYWQTNTTKVVLAYAEGKRILESNRYENRTQLDTKNLTLWISPVEIQDNGPYQCVVQSFKTPRDYAGPRIVCDETVTLSVTADFSEPNIATEVIASSCELIAMVVRCSSHGGFPEPKIFAVLNNVSVPWNSTSMSNHNVTGTLQLNVTEDVNFTCSIEHNGVVRSSSLSLKKTNDCIVPTMAPSYNVITASSVIIIIFLLAITLAARYFPRHVCSHCCKNQDSVEEDVKESMKPHKIVKVTSEMSSL
ncbi:CD80 protein, partial [Alectura lathami]|nr:CD80 protein [Alectura lathami]